MYTNHMIWKRVFAVKGFSLPHHTKEKGVDHVLLRNDDVSDVQITWRECPYMVYVRVSTDKDEQVSSPENQIDICRYWLETNHFEWEEKSVVFDEGISGTVLLDRPAMQLVLEKARKREIKMVIFKSIHRLARDMRDSLEIKETLIAHGVRLVTIEEGYDSLYEGKNDMTFEMFSMFAAQYPKTLSVSITGALAAKVRRGEHLGQIPYGYKSVNKKLTINEEVAPTIRKMFEWYNGGLGFKAVMHKLNKELEKGNVVPPKKSTRWQVTSVRTIIRNPAYAGIFVHNRYTKVKMNGRKKQIQNPREKWTIYEDHHPAIVSRAEWEKANSVTYKVRKKRITPWNEFRELLTCSKCSSNMVVVQSCRTRKKDNVKVEWQYLKCSAYRRSGKSGCVNHAPVLYDDLRQLMLKSIKRKAQHIEVNFMNSIKQKKQREIASLESKLKLIQEKNSGLVDLYLEDNLISKQEFQLKRKEYENEIKRKQDQLFMLKQDSGLQDEMKYIKDAFERLEKYEEDLHHALKVLIEKIVMYPDGKVDIYYSFSK